MVTSLRLVRVRRCPGRKLSQLGCFGPPESAYTKQTGTFTIRHDDGEGIEIAQISRFIDVGTMHSTTRDWSENKRKRYYGPDGREGEFVEGSTEQFYFLDDPDRIYKKVE